MTAPHDAYGEDGQFVINGTVTYTVATGAGRFRAGVARCALEVQGTGFLQRIWPAGPLTSGWVSHRVSLHPNAGGQNRTLLGLTDVNGVVRLGMKAEGAIPSNPYIVFKQDAAGNQSVLFTTGSSFSGSQNSPDKIDFHFNYSATGFFEVYINGVMVGSVQATDITTDGVTQIGGTALGTYDASYNLPTWWSEGIVHTQPTLSMSSYSNAGSGAGTEDQWSGTLTNVNELAVNDLTFDTTNTNGAVQRYLIPASIPNNFAVSGVVTSVRATQGSGNLSNIQLDQLNGGVETTSASQVLPVGFSEVQFIQGTNPKTGVAWTPSDLNDPARESGAKAVT